jgi:hypothetical protein
LNSVTGGSFSVASGTIDTDAMVPSGFAVT